MSRPQAVGIGLGGAVVIIALGWWLRSMPNGEAQSGDVYWRAAIADSAMVAAVRSRSDLAEAGDLIIGALAYRMRVQIDQTGACEDVRAYYDERPVPEDPIEALYAMIAPVPLYESGTTRCFSYRVVYDIPLDIEADTTSHVPFTLALIHPMEDQALLTPE